MSATSFNQIFRAQRLHRDAVAIASLGSMQFHRAIERDALVGKAKSGRAHGGGGGRGTLSHKLAERLGGARRFGFGDGTVAGAYAFDSRQRAVVKIHYFGHGNGRRMRAMWRARPPRGAAGQARRRRSTLSRPPTHKRRRPARIPLTSRAAASWKPTSFLSERRRRHRQGSSVGQSRSSAFPHHPRARKPGGAPRPQCLHA